MIIEKLKKNIRRGTVLKVSSSFILSRLLYQILVYFFRIKLLYKSIFCKTVIRKPYELVDVPTGLIQDTFVSFSKYRGIMFGKTIRSVVGLIKDGDWDLEEKKAFRSTYDYIAFKERFIEDKKWEETLYYERYLVKTKSRERYPTWQKYKSEYLDTWDRVYRDIKDNGYKRQGALKPTKEKLKKNRYYGKPENEIEVAVSRNGEFIFIDGRHRLSIALLLNIEKIPVIVNCWHKSFIDRVKKELNKSVVTPAEAVEFIINCKK